MYLRSEHKGTITSAHDERITPIGHFLRKYKLDEIPQLWNVFIGKMSFVGPRPDVPGYADRLQGEARKILELLPGITGPASLYFRDEERILAEAELGIREIGEIRPVDDVRLTPHVPAIERPELVGLMR